jgi:phosphoglycolate phosphatase
MRVITPRLQPQAILFDLDGTLLDTIADLVTASNLMLSELGRPVRSQAQIHSFVGKGITNLVGRLLAEDDGLPPRPSGEGRGEGGSACPDAGGVAPRRAFPHPRPLARRARGGIPPAAGAEAAIALEVFCRHYTRVNGQTTRPYPGVAELLAALAARKLKMAIVTNKATAFTLPLLEQFDLARYFSAVVCGDTLTVRKPDPAVIDHTCARLGIKPAQALMIGDSANDALAARGAGVPVLLVNYGYSEGMAVDSIECDGLLSNALQVLDYLA